MENFDYFQPTDIKFGYGRISEIGDIAQKIGKRCMLVTVPVFDVIEPAIDKAKKNLSDAGVDYAHFDGVAPNPTTDSISNGAKLAREFKADVIIGLGGGSSMDTAKAIAVESTHKGTSWDYLFFKDSQPTKKTLPVIAVTTTSGTGSQVTQVAVVSNPEEKRKSALYNSLLFPKIAIIDPDLMVTLPEHISASTGFDVFSHAFEAYIHNNTSPYIEVLSLEALKIVIEYLPKIIKNGKDIDARARMAWADTLGGLSIANAGVTLPHGIGMAIGGCCPHVMHGEALAAVYPEFIKYTYSSSKKKFATLARLFNKELESAEDVHAAEESYNLVKGFLEKIKMDISLKDLKVSDGDLEEISKVSLELPDYTNNPRVADLNEIRIILENSWDS